MGDRHHHALTRPNRSLQPELQARCHDVSRSNPGGVQRRQQIQDERAIDQYLYWTQKQYCSGAIHCNGSIKNAGFLKPKSVKYLAKSKSKLFFFKFLAENKLSLKHIENRNLLRACMETVGFKQFTTEWWHFNALPFAEIRTQFKIVE